MFTVYHFIWLGICFSLIAVCAILLNKYKPSLKDVLTIACAVSVISELIKTFSVIQLVPSSDGASMHLYIEQQHLPLHLCSLQIILIFTVRFIKDGKFKEMLLAFMYPSCVIGAFFALLLPTIFTSSIDVSQAFTHPLAYQFFLYHTMLILLGGYILTSRQVKLKPKHYFSTLVILFIIAFVSLYLNSIFAAPTYLNGELISVDYTANFIFTYETPIGIALTKLWHWYLYLAILLTLAVSLIALFYIPIFRANKKTK